MHTRLVGAPRQPCGTRLHSAGHLARLVAFAGPVLAATALGTGLACKLTAGAADPLRWPLLALLSLILLYQALMGWPSMLGFIVRLLHPATPPQAVPTGASRCAVLLPIYNEDPTAVFTAVATMARAIGQHGLEGVDIHVLSDTQDTAVAAAEAAAATRLRASGLAVTYRRRTVNAGRKAGNIAEFCRASGAEYDYMLVLDADSLMGASTIATLIGLMDANPQAGLIQTVPYPVGRETLFARMQQFSARLYAPLLVEGLAFWQQAGSNYWGHNAIIRIAPFMAHCALPVLPGQEPFGGEILCHDVVEAGLLRRAGWEVWMAPGLGASYEALPANIVDYAQRERRWCQGNLQHLGVVGMPGLPAVARYHLLLGVFCYLSGPLVAAFIALAILDGLVGGSAAAALLAPGPWAQTGLLLLTLVLLYGAKLASLAAALLDARASRGFGGRARLLASAALEQLGCMVVAPVMLVMYTRFIGMMLLGRAVQWDAQPRDDRGVSWPEAWRRMRGVAVVGAAWLAGASVQSSAVLGWSLTLLTGLALAAPFAVWTSRTRLGAMARRAGLFLTEDEVAPDAVLRAYQRAMAGPLPQPIGGRLQPHLLAVPVTAEQE